MPAFICTACGTQYPPSDTAPPHCPICEETRQFVPLAGQSWTTQERLALTHFNVFREHEPGVIGIGTQPGFGIGQRALLLQTPHGNVLWDCIARLDAATITIIKALGGLRAMAISHPHFYTTMAEWSRAFEVPVHIHAADAEWIQQPHPGVRHWDGDSLALMPDVTLIRCGGHFAGSSALHWAGGAGGRGLICTSDTATVSPDRKSVSFMRSYPNLIPLSAREVTAIAAALEPYRFDAMYSHFFDRAITHGAKPILQNSAKRYLAAIAAN